MIGIAVQLFISEILLWIIEKEHLNVLGLAPNQQRVQHFLIGLLSPIIFFAILFFTLAYLGDNPYQLNNDYTGRDFLNSIWYLFKSVSFEALIFNGTLLYILMKRIGSTKAVFISAISFGIYHWFSWNLFGQPVAMVATFLTTGLAGYLWSLAFVKTLSVYLPFALHFGVDFVFDIVFSKGKSLGHQLLVQTFDRDPTSPNTVISILLLLIYFLGFPALTFLYLKNYDRKA